MFTLLLRFLFTAFSCFFEFPRLALAFCTKLFAAFPCFLEFSRLAAAFFAEPFAAFSCFFEFSRLALAFRTRESVLFLEALAFGLPVSTQPLLLLLQSPAMAESRSGKATRAALGLDGMSSCPLRAGRDCGDTRGW